MIVVRARPTALGFVDEERSGVGAQWDRAQVVRLARRLGYDLLWPPAESTVPLVDQVREADVDAVLIASPQYLDVLTVDRLMHTCDVEAAVPRTTFVRYFGTPHGFPA